MDSNEDSDEAEDTINVAPIDLTSSESLPPRPPALEAVDSSDGAPESSDDLVVLDSQSPVTTSSANPTRTAKRKRTVASSPFHAASSPRPRTVNASHVEPRKNRPGMDGLETERNWVS